MNDKQKRNKQQVKKNTRKVRFYYSFLTVVLLICLVQVARSAVLNVSKTLNYKVKVKKMMMIREEVQEEHERLENDIKNFGNLKSLEAIARNNLKMAGEDEVLVIINKEKEQKSEEPVADDEELAKQQETKNIRNAVWIKFQNNAKKFKKEEHKK